MNKDSQAILILCSNLCVGEGINPLKPSEWRRLARLIFDNGLTPGSLLDMNTDLFISELGLDADYSNRLERLIGRSASLFFEVSKYENMGISIITRADAGYPQRIKKKLGDSCPPYFFYAGDLSLLKKRGVGFVGSRALVEADIDFETSLVKKVIKGRYAVISGGARGADTISENVAISHGGYMIEFLPNSMLHKLQKSETIKAVQKGRLLLLSVPNPDAGFTVGNAMSNNKYIYAQADAVIAIKSFERGGTWSGVVEGLKHKYCPIFCWDNSDYKDNLELIEKGAIPIGEEWSVKDVEKASKKLSEERYDCEKVGQDKLELELETGRQLSLFNK